MLYSSPIFSQGNSQPNGQPSDPKGKGRYFDVNPDPKDFFVGMTTSNTNITLVMTVGKQNPVSMAIFVGHGEEKTPDNSPAKWIPYTDKVKVDLGEEDGERHIYVAVKWDATQSGYDGSGFGVTVSRSKPNVWLVNPKEQKTSKSVIVVQGYTSKPIESCQYDLYDQAGKETVRNEDGLVGASIPDGVVFTNDNNFSCMDVNLTPGTNTMVLHCVDEGGKMTTTNFVFIRTTKDD